MILFKKGIQITAANLTEFFKDLYIAINGVNRLNIKQLTTGSFLTIGEDADSNVVVSEMMNTSNEQYFDSYIQPYYQVADINGWFGNENYLQDFIDEIELIQNR